MKPKKIVPILLLILSFTTAIILLFETNSLQQELTEQANTNHQLQSELKKQQALVDMDTKLFQGEYDQALSAYEQSLKVSNENNFAIPLRIALAEKLLEKDRAVVLPKKDNSLDDERNNANLAATELNDRIDSLNFAHEKTKAQLSRLKSQLKNKSFGAYLKFKSKKGNNLHYVGQVKGGKANGFGIALLDSGSRYEGQWKDNQREGEGTFYWPDGEYYVGTYHNDKRSGYGTYYWPNGEKYAGQWKEDKRSGSGKFFGTDGDIIAGGQWDDDKLVEVNEK